MSGIMLEKVIRKEIIIFLTTIKKFLRLEETRESNPLKCYLVLKSKKSGLLSIMLLIWLRPIIFLLLKKPILGITCDGAGDGLSATVNICDNNKIKRICEISRHSSIGKIYSRVTYLMGLRPWQDEYKVMGLPHMQIKQKL